MKRLKELFLDNRRWLGVAFLIFSWGVLFGFSIMSAVPGSVLIFLGELEMIELPRGTVLQQIVWIYSRNIHIALLNIFGGILLGFFPLRSLFSNGVTMGMFLYMCSWLGTLRFFLLGILPHGILELPAFMLAGALGLKLGWGWIKRPKKGRGAFLKSTLKEGLFASLVLMILLFFAAVVEATITAWLLKNP